jgi:hypothetical protein
MGMRHLLLSVTLVGVLANGAEAARPACTTSAEREAMTVRAFQSYLMVAAVACNQATAYNGFVTRFQPELAASGQRLKGYFQRVYGGNAEKSLNDYITGLANAWSQVHMANMGGYCAATWETMWRLGKGSPDRAALMTYVSGKSADPAVAEELCSGASVPQVAAAAPAPSVR